MGILETLGFSRPAATEQQPTQQVPAQTPQAPEAEPAPLTTQAEWFKPAETDHKPVEFDPTKLFNANPEELQKAIGGLNFVQSAVTPEVMQKIQAGGEEATQATLSLVNSVAQQTMQASMQASTKMIEAALAKAAPAFQAKISEQTRSERIESAIKEASPIYNSPASEFIVQALKDRFTAKYPNATAEEWRQMAAGYAQDLVKVGSPKQEQSQEAPSTDWARFLN